MLQFVEFAKWLLIAKFQMQSWSFQLSCSWLIPDTVGRRQMYRKDLQGLTVLQYCTSRVYDVYGNAVQCKLDSIRIRVVTYGIYIVHIKNHLKSISIYWVVHAFSWPVINRQCCRWHLCWYPAFCMSLQPWDSYDAWLHLRRDKAFLGAKLQINFDWHFSQDLKTWLQMWRLSWHKSLFQWS